MHKHKSSFISTVCIFKGWVSNTATFHISPSYLQVHIPQLVTEKWILESVFLSKSNELWQVCLFESGRFTEVLLYSLFQTGHEFYASCNVIFMNQSDHSFFPFDIIFMSFAVTSHWLLVHIVPGFIQVGLSQIQGLVKVFYTVFQGLNFMKNTDFSVTFLLQKC